MITDYIRFPLYQKGDNRISDVIRTNITENNVFLLILNNEEEGYCKEHPEEKFFCRKHILKGIEKI